MKILIVGGTGIISRYVCSLLIQVKNEVTVLNRGIKSREVEGVSRFILADINNIELIKRELKNDFFDVVIDFVCFCENDVRKRYEIFRGKLKQYIFISSATVYRENFNLIKENSPIGNSHSLYARNKIECERVLLKEINGELFPVTIIRPSHTFDSNIIPLGIHGKKGSWQNVKRMIDGKKVIIHGDGTGVWAMLRSEDFARQLLGIVGKKEAVGHVFQITSEESLSWNQIYSIVADEVGVELHSIYISSLFLAKAGSQFDLEEKLLGDKARMLTFCNNKIKAFSPGYIPIFSMEQGIRDSVRNVLQNKLLQIEDEEYDKWCDEIIYFYENKMM